MDIAGLSTVLKTVDLQAQVGVAMLSKTLDMNETIVGGFMEMVDASALENSVNPHLGSVIDLRI